MKKRVFSIILAMIMLLAAVPLSAAAESSVLEIDTTYTLVWAEATDETFAYTFTPEESGIFQFRMDDGVFCMGLYQDGGFVDAWYYETTVACFLEAGIHYEVIVQGDGYSDTTSLYFGYADELTSFELNEGADDVYVSLYSEVLCKYTAMPSNDMVATLSFESDDEDVLRCVGDSVKAVGVGDAMLTVTANGMISDTIWVHVREPLVKSGEFSTSVYLNYCYAQTTYQVTVPESGVYRIYSVSKTDESDPRIEICDSQGDRFEFGDDDKGSWDFDISVELDASETYYFVVSSYTPLSICDLVVRKVEEPFQADIDAITVSVGDDFVPEYSFAPSSSEEDVTFVSDDSAVVDVTEEQTLTAVGEGTATITLATASGLTDTVEVTVVAPRTLECDQPYTVNTKDGLWYATFTFVPEEDGDYLFKGLGDYDTVGELYDADGNLINENDDAENGNNFNILETLTAGETYVLRVGLFSYGKAEFAVGVSQAVAAQTVELKVDADGLAASTSDKVFVFKGAYVYAFADFGMAIEEGYSITSSNPDIWKNSDLLCNTLGETVLTVTTDNGLTDSITLVVIEGVLGDVDFSGAVDMMDALSVYAGVSGEIVLANNRLPVAECTGDSAVNTMDALVLYQRVAGAPIY